MQSTSSTAKRKSGFAATAVVEEEGESWEHEEAMRRLPAVPNTQYLQPTGMFISLVLVSNVSDAVCRDVVYRDEVGVYWNMVGYIQGDEMY